MYLGLHMMMYLQLGDLPDEILNRILIKAIIKKILTEKPTRSLTEVDSKEAVCRLRGQLRCVSSSWNNCLSSESFGDMLDSTVNQLGKMADLRMCTDSGDIYL